MKNYKIECYHDIKQFLNTVKNFDKSNNPFLSYAYLSVFFKYFPNGKYDFFNIYECEKLIAIIPFECTFDSHILKVKKLRFIGYRQFNYEQYICENIDISKVNDIIFEYFKKQRYNVVLNIYDINSESPLYQVLDNNDSNYKKIALYSCPRLRISNNFDDFFKKSYSSSKKRSELKKFQRKVSELGDFRMINVYDMNTLSENEKYISQIYKVHQERFSGVYATSFFGCERMRSYYSDLIKSLMIHKKGYISLLVLDGVVIAFVFCLTNGKVLIDWIPAFDPAFARYSLGMVQYKMLFEILCNQNKYEIFDFSKGNSVYKRKWAKEETLNYQFLINIGNKNAIANIIHTLDIWKFSLKVFLRNKGILNIVKNYIGEIYKWKYSCKNKHLNVKVTKIDNYFGDEFNFNYLEICNYPVKVREIVLSALYQGKHIVSVSNNEVVLS